MGPPSVIPIFGNKKDIVKKAKKDLVKAIGKDDPETAFKLLEEIKADLEALWKKS